MKGITIISGIKGEVMRRFVLWTMALVLLCAACTKQKVEGSEDRIITLRMTIPENLENPASGGEGSRATVDDSGYFTWQAGDQIGVYREGNINPVRFNLIEGAGTRYGVFEAAYPFSGKLTGYALYPYDWDSTLSGTTLTVRLPNGPDHNNGKAYLPMLATGVSEEEGASFTFKALGGLLKFTYKEIPTQAARFRFTTKNGGNVLGPAITGSAVVDVSSNKPVLTSVSGEGDNQYRFTLNLPTHSSPIGEMSFYVPLAPEDYKFVFNLRDGTDKWSILMGTQKLRTNNNYPVKQGKLHLMPVVTIPGVYTFEDGTIPENVTDKDTQSGNLLRVVENEFPGFPSSVGSKVLKGDFHNSTYLTSGYFYIYFRGDGTGGTVNGKEYVTQDFRSQCSTFRVRFYHTATACYPYMRMLDGVTSEGGTGRRPARINGHDFTEGNATEANWKAWFKTDDWNVLEWDASQWGEEKTTFESITRFNFRPFSRWDGSGISGPATEAIPRIFYVDDFEMVQNLPVNDEYL